MGLEPAFQFNKHVLSASYGPRSILVSRVSKLNALEIYVW